MTTTVMTESTNTKTGAIKALAEAHIINTYGSRRLAFVRGEGTRLWDADGREYLDCFAGIAVASLGHCHPEVSAAIAEQARTLIHVSNLYYIEPQVKLAEQLCRHSFAEKWFFANCGATANEAAIKIARRYWAQKGSPKPGILVAEQSFHGRTLATITATGQPKYQEGFEPLMPGFTHVPYDDMGALERAMSPQIGAVMLEPVQGESGVRIPKDDYLRNVRAFCDAHKLLLILDEVQTGMGRTGKLFAYEHSGIAPDIITLAKALGNGIPVSAMGCTNEVATGFGVGSHASTFGGNPLCAAAALKTLEVMTRPGFLDKATDAGAYFVKKLRDLASRRPVIAQVRGKGLMIGVEMRQPVAPMVQAMADAGVICGPAGPNVLRFVPPLIITQEEIDQAVAALDRVLGAL